MYKSPENIGYTLIVFSALVTASTIQDNALDNLIH
jgi:hypothetical protein